MTTPFAPATSPYGVDEHPIDPRPTDPRPTPDTNRGIEILPFYGVADVSSSMHGAPVGTLNQLLPRLRDALIRDAVVGDMVRFSLLDFSDDARVVLPMSDIRTVETLPTLTTRGGTRYSRGLALLRQQIEADYRQLAADGFTVKRSAAVFISDGAPTDSEDERRTAFDDLTRFDPETGQGFRRFPNLIPIGVGSARRDALLALRHRTDGPAAMPALFANNGDPVAAIAELLPVLIRSIVNSTYAMAGTATGGGTPAGAAAQAMSETLMTANGFDTILD